MPLSGLAVAVIRPGRSALRLTEFVTNSSWSTLIPGGFGSCTFTLLGDRRRDVPYLSLVRVVWDTSVVYEGIVEDAELVLSDSNLATEITAFGAKRELDRTSIRRIWSQRDMDWREFNPDITYATVETGNYDPVNPNRVGVKIAGTGASITNGNMKRVKVLAPDGMTWATLLGTYGESGANVLNFEGRIESSSDGTTFTLASNPNVAGAFTATLVASARVVTVGFQSQNTQVFTANDFVEFYDMRLLGTSIAEDTSGGFYGGTLLRDLIPLVPNLQVGNIESGSDFTIPVADFGTRANAQQISDYIANFYDREWAVWEDGRFDWETPNLDETQWIVPLNVLSDLSIRSSVDGLVKTVYIQYIDAGDGRSKEETTSSTDRRNPFVTANRTSDQVVDGGTSTSAAAAQLGSRVSRFVGKWPPVSGRIKLPATRLLSNPVRGALPAFMIRAGENVTIPELAKTDILMPGRDGETLFHVVSTDMDADSNMVTLALDSAQSSLDLSLARAGAAILDPGPLREAFIGGGGGKPPNKGGPHPPGVR